MRNCAAAEAVAWPGRSTLCHLSPCLVGMEAESVRII
jgi:hypothetical protein